MSNKTPECINMSVLTQNLWDYETTNLNKMHLRLNSVPAAPQYTCMKLYIQHIDSGNRIYLLSIIMSLILYPLGFIHTLLSIHYPGQTDIRWHLMRYCLDRIQRYSSEAARHDYIHIHVRINWIEHFLKFTDPFSS